MSLRVESTHYLLCTGQRLKPLRHSRLTVSLVICLDHLVIAINHYIFCFFDATILDNEVRRTTTRSPSGTRMGFYSFTCDWMQLKPLTLRPIYLGFNGKFGVFFFLQTNARIVVSSLTGYNMAKSVKKFTQE